MSADGKSPEQIRAEFVQSVHLEESAGWASCALAAAYIERSARTGVSVGEATATLATAARISEASVRARRNAWLITGRCPAARKAGWTTTAALRKIIADRGMKFATGELVAFAEMVGDRTVDRDDVDRLRTAYDVLPAGFSAAELVAWVEPTDDPTDDPTDGPADGPGEGDQEAPEPSATPSPIPPADVLVDRLVADGMDVAGYIAAMVDSADLTDAERNAIGEHVFGPLLTPAE